MGWVAMQICLRSPGNGVGREDGHINESKEECLRVTPDPQLEKVTSN